MRFAACRVNRLAPLEHRGAETDVTPDRQRTFDFCQEKVSKACPAEAAGGSGRHLPRSPDNKFSIDELTRHSSDYLSYAPNFFSAATNFSLGTTP